MSDKSITPSTTKNGNGARKTTAGSAVDTVKTTATDLAHRASDQAAHLKEYAGDRAHYVADRSREGYHFAEDKFESTLEENPLALGAVALAIGAAIGLAIPRTERENKMFGEYREQLFDTAREYAHDAVGQLHTIGEQTGEQVKGQLGQAMKPSLRRAPPSSHPRGDSLPGVATALLWSRATAARSPAPSRPSGRRRARGPGQACRPCRECLVRYGSAGTERRPCPSP
jgi:hypothetical protein